MKSTHCPRWIALLTVLTAGCAAARNNYPPPPLQTSGELVQRGGTLPEAGDAASAAGNRARALRNVLVLSGGGMYGAYSAGVLRGWSESGTRPCFDVVTGISTGALIAPYAFVGPEYDAELERLYTSALAIR